MQPHDVLLVGVVIALLATIVRLLSDSVYGVYTRQCFDLAKPILLAAGYRFILLDIDGMGRLNAVHGYEEVNLRIKKSMRRFTGNRMGDIVFRYYSGDELVIACRGNVYVAARHLQEALAKHDISATYMCGTDIGVMAAELCTVKPKDKVGGRGKIFAASA